MDGLFQVSSEKLKVNKIKDFTSLKGPCSLELVPSSALCEYGNKECSQSNFRLHRNIDNMLGLC